MPYGTIKVDTVTFTDNGVDKNISLSGLVQNPTFTGNVTATGTISGDIIRGGTTISGVTVTGTTANFVSGVFTTQVSGTTVIAPTGTFTSLTGTTATFTSGIIASGTAALPSLAILSDPNTGLFSPGADQLAISTNGTQRLSIGSTGSVNITSTLYVDTPNFRVGIGTASPSEKLTVSGGSIDLPNVNSFIKGGGHNVLQVDATKTYFYGGTGGVQLRTADNTSDLINITNAGLVGIGTSSPGDLLTLNSAGYPLATFNDSGTFRGQIGYTFDYGYFHVTSASTLGFRANGSERARIDSSGRLLVGTSTARANFFNTTLTAGIQVEGTGGTTARGALSVVNNDSSNNPSLLILGRSGAATLGSNSVLSSGDWIGTFSFQGADGTELVEAANITAYVDGTPGANDMPGRLVFSTTADGAASPTERMRIANTGDVLINKTGVNDTTAGFRFSASNYFSSVRASGAPGYINRLTDDGVLLEFAQDSTTEGTISVSGTTVSYNGAHLSRWSQLAGGATREEILRGTVLSNIDEMCGWGDEENEQLNRMKVSDVEGDKNVSGVFQCWDDDDDTYTDDFYCAMTGDFIIRIAEGVTVERGDLLMSAGDGTAKPQDDDIIRSKTIAKVTSTHVTCTYEDGSYCVPCVLMAC